MLTIEIKGEAGLKQKLHLAQYLKTILFDKGARLYTGLDFLNEKELDDFLFAPLGTIAIKVDEAPEPETIPIKPARSVADNGVRPYASEPINCAASNLLNQLTPILDLPLDCCAIDLRIRVDERPELDVYRVLE